MRYGYTRTSTADKQLDGLQRHALLKAGVDPERIYTDQASGTQPLQDRPGWS